MDVSFQNLSRYEFYILKMFFNFFRGCFLTSSLIATLSMSLTIPMSMFADVILDKVTYPCMFYIGMVPMVAAFCSVTLLYHFENWDPVSELLKWCYFCTCSKTRTLRIAESEVEQTEALIGINHSDNDNA